MKTQIKTKISALAMAMAFLAPTAFGGSIARHLYDDATITGATVDQLRASFIFPDAPSYREELDDYTPDLNDNEVYGFQGKENAGDNYGSFARGYIQIPEDGDYTFYISSDDAGELWLSPDINPANVERIAIQNGCCDPLFGANRLDERSATLTGLKRGAYHYIEAYQVEGGGGAYLQVGWMKPDGTQEIIPARHLIQFYADPGDSLGGIAPRSGTSAPRFNPLSNNGAQGGLADVSTTEGLDAMMDVDVIGTMPMTFSWKVNGQAIDNPLSYIKVEDVPLSMDGTTVEVTISNSLGSITSSANLTVARDTVAPKLISARGSGLPAGIIVTFSEKVAEASATNPANYTISGQDLTIQGASLLTPTSVLLSVSEYTTDSMSLSVSGVTDIAATPNRIAAGSTTGIALTTTLMAYWDFNDTSNSEVTIDSSGGHAAEIILAKYTAPGGGFTGSSNDAAMDFGDDNAGQYLFVEDARFLNSAAPGDALTISLWQKNEATGNSSSFWLVSPGSSGTQRGFQAHIPWSNSNLYFDTAGCCAGATQRINAHINTFSGYYEGFFNDWHHYAFIKNGDNKQIWIDGTLFLEGTNTGDLPGDFTTMTIGSAQNGGNSVQAVIDDFSIFSVALTPEEVGGLAGKGAPTELSMPLSAPITLVSQPQSQDLEELLSATFSVEATGGSLGSIGYQWYRNGSAIVGATSSSYTTGSLSTDDDGAVFMAKVFNLDGAFNSIDSEEAVLSVSSDRQAPLIVNSKGNFDLNKVIVEFDEGLDPATAETVSNYAIEGLTVQSATLSASGNVVILETSAQTPGTTYTITTTGVADLSTAANTTAGETDTFISWDLLPGGVVFEAFTGIGGTPIANLTGNARFPDDVNETRFLSSFDTPNGYGENYGARVRGWFAPKVSGEYTFFIRSDDASALWFNPDGEAPVGPLTGDFPIAEETGCCKAFQEPGSPLTSAPYTLQAGNRYYMEGIIKEAGGGDYFQVAYRLSNDSTAAANLDPISGDELVTRWDIDADLEILAQPANQLAILPSPGDEVALFDFADGDGGFTVTTEGAVPGPWIYDAATGSWIADGSVDGCGGPYHSILTSPAVTVPSTGGITVRFNHRYAFEGGLWDAGQLRFSVNGSEFTAIPAGNVVQNGYAAGNIVGSGILNGQRGFNDTSAGYEQGVNITTTAIISMLNAGDSVQVQFLGGWDDCATGINPNWVISNVGFFSLPPIDQDFAMNDGGLSVETVGAVPFPWVYSEDRGVWFADGSVSGCGGPYWSFLNSPNYLVVEDGEVILSVDHRYAFEGDLWDGGQIRISVNGGDYTAVPAEAFTQNGYAEGNIVGSGILNGLRAFNATSTGHAGGQYITSVCSLGSFSAGDFVSVQFLGGWDDCSTGAYPNWEIKSLVSDQLVIGSVPVASTFMVAAAATQHGQAISTTYQWQRDDGNGFVNIPGATGSSYAIFPEEADLNALFRVLIGVPGVELASSTARLTTGMEPKATIAWVSFHAADDMPSADAAGAGFTEAPDKGYTDLLTANGYAVNRVVTSNSPNPADFADADLVIISRSVPSGDYSGDGATAWNSLDSKVMILGGYVLRSSRMGFTTGTTMVDTTTDITLAATMPNHPIFEGVTLDASGNTSPFATVVTYNGTLQRGVSVNNNPLNGGGRWIAGTGNSDDPTFGGPVIAEWSAGDVLTHSGGAGSDALAGRRLVFLTGSREQGITSHGAGIYDLLPAGESLFLNAVDYMIFGEEYISSGGAMIAIERNANGSLGITYTSGTLQSAPSVNGPWTDVNGASSPYTATVDSQMKYYRTVE